MYVQADALNEPALKAILAGLKKRYEKSGEKPILIHTVHSLHSCPSVAQPAAHHNHTSQSGTGLLADDARGEYKSTTVVSDLDQATLDAIQPGHPLHVIDLLATSADAEGCRHTRKVRFTCSSAELA